MRRALQDGEVAGAGGNQPGFTSMLYYVPVRRLIVAIMTNRHAGDDPTELARRLAAAAYDGTRERRDR